MIITIDGPAGSGKSTVSREVARRLGFDYLDTGAMYRAVALEAIRRQTNLDDPRELALVAQSCHIEFDFSRDPPLLLLNGQPVSHLLRSPEVASVASKVAVVPAVRQRLIQEQRRIGNSRANLITEGRDQGSVVFPDAQLKFFLDASVQERARRRAAELQEQGEIVDPHEVLQQILERDRRDTSRAADPLRIPDGAERIDTTSLTRQQVVEHVLSRVLALLGSP